MVAKALPRATRALIASTHPEPKRESAPRVLPRINHGLFHDSPAFSANVMPNISEPVPKIRFLQTFIEHVQMIDFQNED
jgi:hypothetical protein